MLQVSKLGLVWENSSNEDVNSAVNYYFAKFSNIIFLMCSKITKFNVYALKCTHLYIYAYIGYVNGLYYDCKQYFDS